MGKVVGIDGESGVGKTYSLFNFEEGEVGIFNVSKKPSPFKKKLPMAMTNDYKIIKDSLRENNLNCYVIDDAGLLMTFFLFDRCQEPGYAKFTQAAKDFYDLVQCAINETSDDTLIYFMMHTERSDDGSRIKMKTGGKMIDNQLTLESLFSIVLYAMTDGKKHVFVTQSDGVTTAKSPYGMFPLEIDNDLKAVDTAIREYYGLAPLGATVKKPKAESKATVTMGSKVPGGN